MRLILVLLSLACLAAADLAPLYMHKVDGIEGQYIVALKDWSPGVEDFLFDCARDGVTIIPKKLYRGGAFKGFSAVMNPTQVDQLRRRPEVSYIEQNAVVRTQWVASWGLDRVNQRKLPLNGKADFTGTGKGVNAYIIDTGIFPENKFFAGRAAVAYDAIKDGRDGIDCNGHGSHCSGTIGGEVFGIAREADLYGVRVLNCGGSGSYEQVIDGMDWVAKNGKRPAVASMSLGGGFSQAMNDAVKNMFDAGVTVSVAAGNNGGDACQISPASAEQAITVGATDITDNRASFSNYGKCVDIFAPGVNIPSTWLGANDYGINVISGTSMACPHVTGAAVLVYGNNPNITAPEVTAELLKEATSDVVINPGNGSPNLFLYIP